ncbi:MAG: KUP/HAK/KT family potassium transporter, partial [Rhizomicrobium sp.]
MSKTDASAPDPLASDLLTAAEIPVAHHATEEPRTLKRDAVLTLGALGVVFGDIGTSPLYAMRETVLATGGAVPSHDAIFGALSLILWALVIIVTLKYVILIMRADNNGEGGVLALATLAHRSQGLSRRV